MTTSIAVGNAFSNVWNSAPSSHDWNKSQLTGPLREQIAQEHKRMEGIEKPEQDVSRKPEIATGRPPGDNRTAEQIINDNPILKNLGHQKDVSRSLAYKLLGIGRVTTKTRTHGLMQPSTLRGCSTISIRPYRLTANTEARRTEMATLKALPVAATLGTVHLQACGKTLRSRVI